MQRIGSLVQILQSKKVTKSDIIEKLNWKYNHDFSISQIEKDLYILKNDFDAPILTEKRDRSFFYWLPNDYDFKEALYKFVCL